MNTIFTLGDETSEKMKLNLDELYEKKQQQDLNTLSLYNKILGRIHTKIKTVSRQQTKEQFCWYVMPETMIGVPKYDHGACTAYIIDNLQDNGFIVKYTHPNLLLISWANWCPSYVRSEIKKKTGVVIDGNGRRLDLDENGKVIHGGNNGSNGVLIEIQTRLEFQDLTIAELNDVITDQQKQLDRLSRRLEMLGDNLKVLEASVETEQDDEKPPHY